MQPAVRHPGQRSAVHNCKFSPFRGLERELSAISIRIGKVRRFGFSVVGWRIGVPQRDETGNDAGKFSPRRKVDGDMVEPRPARGNRGLGAMVEHDEFVVASAEMNIVFISQQLREADVIRPECFGSFGVGHRKMDWSEFRVGREQLRSWRSCARDCRLRWETIH